MEAWQGERRLNWPADVVFAQLLAVLEAYRFSITKADADEGGVVAETPMRYRGWWGRRMLPGRFAARVESSGDGASVITVEYGPQYVVPRPGWHVGYQREATMMLDLVERALAA
jgi:hypothetical protein